MSSRCTVAMDGGTTMLVSVSHHVDLVPVDRVTNDDTAAGWAISLRRPLASRAAQSG